MTGRASVDWRGRPVEIEVRRLDAAGADRPLVVFLHEGLGSVSAWRDFPDRLCRAVDARGLVYSRPGYGLSTPRALDEHWGADFLHRQAREVLPALLRSLGIDEPVWLFGHSDGGSIALLFAAMFPAAARGLVLLAPHIFTEDIGIASIAAAREAYLHGDLKARLARHHADVDSAFWGWNDIWLDPAFRGWTLEAEIARVTAPILAVQGLADEYGTLAQVRGIAARLPQARVVELADCGHAPQRDQAAAVCEMTRQFIHDNDRRLA